MLKFNSEEEVSSALFPRGNPRVPLRVEHRGKLQSFLVDDDHGNVHRLGVHGAHVHQCAAKPLRRPVRLDGDGALQGLPEMEKGDWFHRFNGYLTLRVYSLKGLKPVSLLVGGGQRRVWRAAGAVKGHGCCCGA